MIFIHKPKYQNNSFFIVRTILKSLNVKYSNYFLRNEINSFPIKGNIGGIQDVLAKYKIETLAVKLSFDQIVDLNLNAILYLNSSRSSFFSLLTKAGNDHVRYFVPNVGDIEETKEEFLKKWSGICILLNEEGHIKTEINYVKNVTAGYLNIGRFLFLPVILIFCYYACLRNNLLTTTSEKLITLLLISLNFVVMQICLNGLISYWDSVSFELKRFGSISYIERNYTNEILLIVSFSFFFQIAFEILSNIITTQNLFAISFLGSIILMFFLSTTQIYSFVTSNKFSAKILQLTTILLSEIAFIIVSKNIILGNSNMAIFYGFLVVQGVGIIIFLSIYYGTLNLKIVSCNKKEKLNQRSEVLKSLIGEIKYPLEKLQTPLLKIIDHGDFSIILLISPYDNSSGQIFLEVVRYLNDKNRYNIQLCFVGNEHDALYCQFAGYSLMIFNQTEIDFYFESITWWYQQKDKNFEKFIERFPLPKKPYSNTFFNWNSWVQNNNLLHSSIITNQNIISSQLHVADIIISLDILYHKHQSGN